MKTRIVPAIDLIDGKCVRLRRGSFSESEVVGDDPVSVARNFSEQGFGRLHLVDLSGAKDGAPRHLEVLRAISVQTSLQVDYSGGLRTRESVSAALTAGAQQVVIGTAAVVDRAEVISWFEEFGSEAIILALDVFEGTVRVRGWQEDSKIKLEQVIEWYTPCGLSKLMSTDISCDGMMRGPSLDLYCSLKRQFPILQVIASGGVSKNSDVRDLAAIGVEEIIVGKALYAGSLNLDEVEEFVW